MGKQYNKVQKRRRRQRYLKRKRVRLAAARTTRPAGRK